MGCWLLERKEVQAHLFCLPPILLPIQTGASLHSRSLLEFTMHVCLSGPSSSYPKLHRRLQTVENSLLHGGKMAPFSGASSCSQSLGWHTAILPDQVLVGRHMRRLEPLSVYPVLHPKRQNWPVWLPHGSIRPLRGASNDGHCWAACY